MAEEEKKREEDMYRNAARLEKADGARRVLGWVIILVGVFFILRVLGAAFTGFTQDDAGWMVLSIAAGLGCLWAGERLAGIL